MVKVEVAVLPPGMIEVGANEHFKLVGSPGQASATALSREPPCGVTLTVSIPEPPVVIAIDVGFAPRVNPEPVLVPVPHARFIFTADDIWFVTLGFPIAWT